MSQAETRDGLDGVRKQEEARFHDLIRGAEVQDNPSLREYYTANRKFYSIARASNAYYEERIVRDCQDKRVLDYCCGGGYYAVFAVRHGAAEAVGIDISPVTIDIANERAARENLGARVSFEVMDAEALEFEDESFDLVIENGALHHLHLPSVWLELNRVLRPGGRVICVEALGENPLFQWYRERTPHLRTAYETQHILDHAAIRSAMKYFDALELRYFHLLSLAAVPFRGRRGFGGLLKLLEAADSVLLRLPLIRNMAWIVVFSCSKPARS